MADCPICGGREYRTLSYPGAASALGLEAILVCSRCGAGRAVPRPDQATLDRFYASGAYWHTSSGAGQRAHEASQAWRRVAHVRRFAQGRALAVADIGAGHGGIPRALAAFGNVSRYAFIEPDEQAASGIRALRLPFELERARSLDELRGPFDVLFLNHVLEHVAEPLAFLRQAAALLAPDGLAYVETPHADYRFKSDVFPHVFFFTPRAFERLGKDLGARTLACESFGRMPAPRFSPVGFAQRLAARALPRTSSVTLQRVLDGIIWRYSRHDDGVWLRWIFSPTQARQASGTNAR